MKWLLVSSSQSLILEYHLVDNDQCLMVLKHNPVHHSIRVSSHGSHKLFFIESTGALTGKYIFHNEYDMEIGHMEYDKWFGKKGIITIESKKYSYQIADGLISIFQEDSPISSIKCEWNNGEAPAQKNSSVENNFLLLGLCWYLYLPVAKKMQVEYAA